MKRLRKILWVSWAAKKTNEWVLNKAGVKRELSDTVKSKEASILWSHLEETRCVVSVEIVPIAIHATVQKLQ